MDFDRFLQILASIFSSNGHFISWWGVERRNGDRGILVTARDGGRFLLVARPLSDEEAAAIFSEMMEPDYDEIDRDEDERLARIAAAREGTIDA